MNLTGGFSHSFFFGARLSAGLAQDQGAGKHDLHGINFLLRRKLRDKLRGQFSHLPGRRINRGQRRIGISGVLVVIEAENGHSSGTR